MVKNQDAFTEIQKIFPSGGGEEAGEEFGNPIAIDGNYIIALVMEK